MQRMSFIKPFLIFVFIANPIVGVKAEPPAHWQNIDYITASFLDIALNSEYDSRVSKLRKWHSPIYYKIEDNSMDQSLHRSLVKTHLTQLSDITSLSIEPANKASAANLDIIFTAESELENVLKQQKLVHNPRLLNRILYDTICLGHITINSDFEIEHATVIIPIDRARAHGKLVSCIIEELTQTLGLINDSDKVFPSIFNDKSFDTYLSGLDYILLSLLYHPSLKAGMNHHQVANTSYQLLNSQHFKDIVKNAEQLVRQNSLYNLEN